MSSIESSIKHWQSLAPSQPIEIGLVQVEVTYHPRLYSDYSDQDMKYVKDIVRNSFYTIAELRGGKLSSREGDGGAFMFLIEGNDSYNNCCLAAIQMLEMMPSLNQDIRSSTDLDCPIEVRISADAGLTTYEPEAPHHGEDFVNKLMRYGRQVGAANRVTITDRIYRQLTRQLKARFVSWKYSAELGTDLYGTPAAAEQAAPPEEAPPAPRAAPAAEGPAAEGPALPRAGTGLHEAPPPAAGRPRWPAGFAGAWRTAGVALAALFAGLFLARALTRPAAPPPAAPAWNEPVRSEEWAGWRQRVHEKLSAAEVNEEALAEAVRVRPPAAPEHQAAALRRDQAVADVLLSYDGVRTILRKRFGIDNQDFLGTGLSKPVGEHDYSSASVHEYLVPNYPDTRTDVWTWQLQPIGPNFRRRVREVIAGDPEKKLAPIPPTFDPKESLEQNLTDVILPRIKARDMSLPPVIRFAQFPAKFYSHKMGRKDAVRVFASNLAEVWDLSVQEAARLSGYTFGVGSEEGDSFFIWVFVPNHPDDVVPATWGEVLGRLPGWLDAAAKAP